MSKNHIECRIRVAVHSDIEPMVSLLKELFEIEGDFSPDAEAQRRGLKMILDNSADAGIFVAEDNGEIVGMCALHRRISTFYGAEAGVVEDLVVKKEFRGRGLGSLLLHAIERHAQGKGFRHLQLLMDKENRSAEMFYSGHGWKKTGLVCMRKNLGHD
ncbi:MAG: GNAT family N-acetyltransferase [Victivallales bacterium]